MLYYYVLNQQGDVIAITNAVNGAAFVEYEYDPWGAVTVYDNSGIGLGEVNPLRYRGYYYDTETGFYYLQSRYYDPVIGRFISADSFATTDCNGFLSANMFAYCENNPVNYRDSEGQFPIVQLAAAVIGGGINLATSWISAKVTGQDFGFVDGLLAFGAGAVGTIIAPPGKKMISLAMRATSAVISAASTAVSVSKNGASGWTTAFCGVMSFTTSFFSFSNLAGFRNDSWAQIGYKAITDASFGWGSNLAMAGVTATTSVPNSNRSKNTVVPTSTFSNSQHTPRIRSNYAWTPTPEIIWSW